MGRKDRMLSNLLTHFFFDRGFLDRPGGSSPPRHHEDLSFDIELVSFREATGQHRAMALTGR